MSNHSKPSVLSTPSNRSLLERLALLDLQAQTALQELENIRLEQLRLVTQFHELEGRAAKQAKHLDGVLTQRQSTLTSVQESLEQVGAGMVIIAAGLPEAAEVASARRLLAVRMSFDPALQEAPLPMETDSSTDEIINRRSRSPSPTPSAESGEGYDEVDQADA